MMPYETFRRSHRVSIWIGDFDSVEELDEYLCMSNRFENDFGFKLNDRSMPETTVEADRVPIAVLLDGFSWVDTFREAAETAARESGEVTATTMVIFHNFAYDPKLASPAPYAPLRFLGVVPFEVEQTT